MMVTHDLAIMGINPGDQRPAFVGRSSRPSIDLRASWTTDPARITRFRDRRDVELYKQFGLPGGGAGLSIVFVEKLGASYGHPHSRSS